MRQAEWQRYLVRARAELANKRLVDVQYDTAYTWAARALVAWENGHEHDGDELAHEAAEHAALAELGGRECVQEILRILRDGRGR